MSARGGSKESERPALLHTADGGEHRVWVERAPMPGLADDIEHYLEEALVPVFLWRAVPVVLQRQNRISVIERFTLEAVEELGALAVGELADLTALPERALAPMLRRLLASGALDVSADYLFTPTAETRRVLTAETVTVLESSVQDFAYFPQTDELLALTDANAPWRSRLSRMRPALQMPVGDPLAGLPRSEVINRHLIERSAHGCPEELFRALEPEEDEPVGELCPVYHGRPVECHYDRERDRAWLKATFRPRAGQGGGSRVEATLGGVDGLIERWGKLSDLAWNPDLLPLLWQALARAGTPVPKGVVVSEVFTPQYAMSLPEDATLALHRGAVALSEPVSLRLRDEEAALLIGLELRPAEGDEGAVALFALDRAAHGLAADPSVGCDAMLDEAALFYRLPTGSGRRPTPDEVREHMWRLGFYDAVYALRENDDFGYT